MVETMVETMVAVVLTIGLMAVAADALAWRGGVVRA